MSLWFGVSVQVFLLSHMHLTVQCTLRVLGWWTQVHVGSHTGSQGHCWSHFVSLTYSNISMSDIRISLFIHITLTELNFFDLFHSHKLICICAWTVWGYIKLVIFCICSSRCIFRDNSPDWACGLCSSSTSRTWVNPTCSVMHISVRIRSWMKNRFLTL